MEVPTEPGQVVATGQTVIKLARDGAREAEINLPEDKLSIANSGAAAILYGAPGISYPAKLRELSAVADPVTRTYRARYVLSGGGENAPLEPLPCSSGPMPNTRSALPHTRQCAP